MEHSYSFLFILKLMPEICCFFEKLAVDDFTFTALRSADKFSNEQKILRLYRDSGALLRNFVRIFLGGVRDGPGLLNRQSLNPVKKVTRFSKFCDQISKRPGHTFLNLARALNLERE